MKIDSANVGMDSVRSYKAATYSYRRFELRDYSNVKAGIKGNAEDKDTNEKEASKENADKEVVKVGPFMATDSITYLQQRMSKVRYDYKVRTEAERDAETIRQESIKYIFELLFGRTKERIKRLLEEHSTPNVGKNTGIGTYETSPEQLDALFRDGGNDSGQFIVQPSAKGMNYSFTRAEYQYESEETTFSAKGVVRTADGREIPFNIDVGMSREFESFYEENTNVSIANLRGTDYAALCDPLVINLNNNVASVSDQKIRFDIDGDGELDSIGRLAQGSGYLALDKNNDGKINDGTELFGTKSGDGFADLAEYDEDGNGWIDENDAVWSKLRIMSYDANGKENLYTLAQSGVGAICLSRVATDFSQKDDENATQSVVRSTGIFLYENGAAGTVQHMDVAKYRQEA